MLKAAVHPGAGLFLTSLVNTQTNVDRQVDRERRRREEKTDPEFDRQARRAAYERPPVTPVEIRFRHSGWIVNRLRVQHALLAANVPASRFERFKECGSDCVVEFSPSRNRHRTRANYCGDRFCVPCARARARRVQARLAKLIGGKPPLLIHLTVRNVPGTLTDRLNHLLESYRRLRQQKFWKDSVVGSAAFIEIKKGENSNEWHPHIHCVAEGAWLDQEELKRGWLKATGDSFIVEVQRARSVEDGIGYAGKYATKGWTAEVVRDHDSLVECVLALRGRRLCITGGKWHGADDDDDDSGEQDWRRVGRLDHVYDRFIAGEPWATAAVLGLLGGDEEKTRLLFKEDGG